MRITTFGTYLRCLCALDFVFQSSFPEVKSHTTWDEDALSARNRLDTRQFQLAVRELPAVLDERSRRHFVGFYRRRSRTCVCAVVEASHRHYKSLYYYSTSTVTRESEKYERVIHCSVPV